MRALAVAALLALAAGCNRGEPVPGRDTLPKDTEGPTKAINSPIDANTPRTPPPKTSYATEEAGASGASGAKTTPRER
jgi:hypothetical protein